MDGRCSENTQKQNKHKQTSENQRSACFHRVSVERLFHTEMVNTEFSVAVADICAGLEMVAVNTIFVASAFGISIDRDADFALVVLIVIKPVSEV